MFELIHYGQSIIYLLGSAWILYKLEKPLEELFFEEDERFEEDVFEDDLF